MVAVHLSARRRQVAGWKNILPTTKGICKKQIVSFVHHIKHIIVPIRFAILGSQSDRRILPRTGNILHFCIKAIALFLTLMLTHALTRSADHWDCNHDCLLLAFRHIAPGGRTVQALLQGFISFNIFVQQ